ncbi:MAG TPA: type II toxin-antitoxin system VapC family toxin [Verrucomicrobiae bacterium]|jgi:PIN domain nuclease of toxin-antitoxin system|nr:type II toxin-antitoxin system VapC family toxin [Verrucomicrobiae bacterium]
MHYLLDTSVWLRAALFGQTLPEDARRIMASSKADLAISIYSLWEAAKKHQKGKLQLPVDLAEWFKTAIPPNLRVLPVTPEIIVESTRLPDFPVNDSGDELIVATARVHNVLLLTTDTQLRGYRHARIRYFKPIPPKT